MVKGTESGHVLKDSHKNPAETWRCSKSQDRYWSSGSVSIAWRQVNTVYAFIKGKPCFHIFLLRSITPLWHCWLILSSSDCHEVMIPSIAQISTYHNTKHYLNLDLSRLLTCIFVLTCFPFMFMNNCVSNCLLLFLLYSRYLMFHIPWL